MEKERREIVNVGKMEAHEDGTWEGKMERGTGREREEKSRKKGRRKEGERAIRKG